jgi:hypothetical protein
MKKEDTQMSDVKLWSSKVCLISQVFSGYNGRNNWDEEKWRGGFVALQDAI